MSNKAPIIIGLICCFLSVSGSIGGAVYWKRCDLELVDCPSPSPEVESELLKDSGEDCLLSTDCKSGLSCLRTSDDLKSHCYSIEDCRSKRIENKYYAPDDVSCGKVGCMDPVASNYNPNAVYEIPGTCLTDNVCEALDLNNDGDNSSADLMTGLQLFGVKCDNIPEERQSLKDLCYNSQTDAPASEATFSQELLNKMLSAYDC